MLAGTAGLQLLSEAIGSTTQSSRSRDRERGVPDGSAADRVRPGSLGRDAASSSANRGETNAPPQDRLRVWGRREPRHAGVLGPRHLRGPRSLGAVRSALRVYPIRLPRGSNRPVLALSTPPAAAAPAQQDYPRSQQDHPRTHLYHRSAAIPQRPPTPFRASQTRPPGDRQVIRKTADDAGDGRGSLPARHPGQSGASDQHVDHTEGPLAHVPAQLAADRCRAARRGYGDRPDLMPDPAQVGNPGPSPRETSARYLSEDERATACSR
jgi:hypothetical protein